jgi:hypothetical protein
MIDHHLDRIVALVRQGRRKMEAPPDPPEALIVPIAKSDAEEQTVTGIALRPEVVDAHGDIIGADVIRQAAHGFVARYNEKTKVGVQHKMFPDGIDLVESYLAPSDLEIGGAHVSEGSWVVTVKVRDSDLWQRVKAGELTGFSIGGWARVRRLEQPS